MTLSPHLPGRVPVHASTLILQSVPQLVVPPVCPRSVHVTVVVVSHSSPTSTTPLPQRFTVFVQIVVLNVQSTLQPRVPARKPRSMHVARISVRSQSSPELSRPSPQRPIGR